MAQKKCQRKWVPKGFKMHRGLSIRRIPRLNIKVIKAFIIITSCKWKLKIPNINKPGIKALIPGSNETIMSLTHIKLNIK